MTKVINLFAGAGSGKSTVAADLYSKLKLKGYNVELAREFIKKWVWNNQTPSKFDQIYILGQQTYEESILYNKVDFIITDSPILLIPFYEKLLIGEEIVKPAVFNFINFAEQHGIIYYNFWLERPTVYQDQGRYQTMEEAKEIDQKLLDWLKNHNISFDTLNNNHDDRINAILDKILK